MYAPVRLVTYIDGLANQFHPSWGPEGAQDDRVPLYTGYNEGKKRKKKKQPCNDKMEKDRRGNRLDASLALPNS